MADHEKTGAPPAYTVQQTTTNYPSAPPAYTFAAQQAHAPTITSQTAVVHPGYNHADPPPRDYFTASILATIFCFWPTGLIAIMRASETRTAVARGDMAVAQIHSRSARTLYHVTIGIGVIFWLLIVSFVIILVVLARSRHH